MAGESNLNRKSQEYIIGKLSVDNWYGNVRIDNMNKIVSVYRPLDEANAQLSEDFGFFHTVKTIWRLIMRFLSH